MNNFTLWFLAWVIFIPYFFLLKGKSPRQAFWVSYAIDIVFYLFTIYWLVHVTLVGLILVALYLALYFGVFGAIFSYTQRRPRPVFDLFFIPAAWVCLEFIRSHLFTGFGWALLGHSQYKMLPIIQIADLTGAYGVSFLVMMFNYAVYSVFVPSKTEGLSTVYSKKTKVLTITICAAFLFSTIGYGFYKLHYAPRTTHHAQLKVSVIQGNIPQEQKWDQAYVDSIIDKYIRLTSLAQKDAPDLIIWPETAVPGFLNDEEDLWTKVSDLAKQVKIPILLGSPIVEYKGDKELYYNSALLVSPNGLVAQQYDKIHLVPFGEYIPFEDKLPFLKTGRLAEIAGFSPGKEYTIFEVKGSRFGVLVCFEDIFPGLVRQFVKRGADFMVVITNDAWFKKTKAPYQHAQASIFRAVENRVSIVRAANTGLSCFIDDKGKIYATVKDAMGKEIFVDGLATAEVKAKAQSSFYTKHGDLFVLLCFSVLGLGLLRRK